jgi:hypothetical protein
MIGAMPAGADGEAATHPASRAQRLERPRRSPLSDRRGPLSPGGLNAPANRAQLQPCTVPQFMHL